jgi:hypothetical protein|nr:MAG TPA: hypothetical protein [Caudoviricetes sp.]
MIKKLISILTSCILAGSLMVGCSEDTTKNLDEKGKQALATTKKEEHDYKKVTELTLSNDYEDEYVEITGTVKEFKTEYNTMIITLDFEKAILPVYVHIPKNMVDVKFEVGDTIIAYGRCCGLRKRSDERYFQINAYFLSKTPIIKKEQSNQNKENKTNSKSTDNNKLENNNQSTNTTKKVQQTKKKTVNEQKQQKEKTKPYVDEKNNVYVDEDGNRQPLVKHDHMTEEYDKQPKCPECGYPVDDCHCNGDGNTVDEEDDNYNWDYYDEPMDEDSWNINNDKQQEQEETQTQQDNNQSQQYNSKDDEEILN